MNAKPAAAAKAPSIKKGDHLYLIDGSGRVRAVTRGFRAGEARALRREIEALLAPGRDALPTVAAGPAER